MNSVKIKLCGMSRPEDIEVVNTLKPDFVGFVLFFPKSVRNVSPEQAASLKKQLDPSIRAVGVFVDSPVEDVAELLRQGIIDIAQLHGHEDNAYIAALRQRVPCTVIQAFKVRSVEDIRKAEQSDADYILLDNGTGTGERFDWSLLQAATRPYFLAGGLNPDNAAEAVTALHPYAVDVSSGIETEKKKDPEKMRRFCENVRQCK